MSFHTYLPQDRWRALVQGETLPDRTHGSALFADISGFTALTEALVAQIGARRGTEELSRQVNAVYDALIGEIERYGGSVISFAGDAVICWFDGQIQDSAVRSIDAALAMQSAMKQFPGLGLKVAIASGPARRFVVGDPDIQLLDALAGATVARTASGEHLALRGEVLVDEETARMVGDTLVISEWRTDAESRERFAAVEALGNSQSIAGNSPVPALVDPASTGHDDVRRYLLPTVFQHEISGRGTFLTEVRPCAVLFVRFTGIDYDSDDAQAHLDAFIRQLQATIAKYEGLLLQLNIGDKGSYVYANFGALNAHEDDARRAVKAALELNETSPLQLQMGLSYGLMRVGAYGGTTRKTFGALGDDVNLAARLMTTATTGGILVSSDVHQAVRSDFVLEPRSPLPMKGKAEPLPVFAVTGKRQQRAIRLQEPRYALPMVGRKQELQVINEKLDLAAEGNSQVVGIVAEAGLGKSRLVAEVIRSARKKGFAGYGGACQSDALNTPYQAWKSIWQAFFDVDPDQPLRKQMRWLEGEIEDRAPTRVDAMPLLNVVLDLNIPENEFTQTLEPKIRLSALHALLEDCMKAQAGDEPLLIVIEDMHWIDALSHDLLEELAKALANYPVCFVLAYRPPQLARLEAPRLEALPQFTRIELHELTSAEAESAIRAKLMQLYPARDSALPSGLVETLMARSQGNPFYLEELLNYVRDRGLDPSDIENIELPDSLHTLILSRIDRLSEQERSTLRVASIVGRLFRATWLTGYYPELGAPSQVKDALDTLDLLDITPLDTPEPELTYLFKHIVTHEVTYESLPYTTRARLHERLAAYLETRATVTTPMLDAIAYHYGLSDNTHKQREYFQKAAEAAQAVSAYTTAAEYLTRLLDLTPDIPSAARSMLARQLAEVRYRLGDFPAARAAIDQALAAAATDRDRAGALAMLSEMTSAGLGDYVEAQSILDQAVPLARASSDDLTLCRALYALSDVYYRLGNPQAAKMAATESLALARSLGDLPRELWALNMMGLVAGQLGNAAEEERLYTEVHTRATAAGNRDRAMIALNNLGALAEERGDLAAAQTCYRQAITIAREIGSQSRAALFFYNLATIDLQLGQFDAARAGLREGLALALRLGALPRVVLAVFMFGKLVYAEGQTERALALMGLARNQPAWSSEFQRQLDIALAQWGLDPSVVEAGMKKGEALEMHKTVQQLLIE